MSSDSNDEYSDVDFWGGESPHLLSHSPTRRPDDAMPLDDEETEEESGEDEDDDMVDDDDDEDNDDGEDEEGEEGTELSLDRMEIFGHRIVLLEIV
ncbi:uncharacterized protein KY384_006986 [Bacidia gigantensis]|uniref:uncharacterized protein n=1 Tax=Bacidia gigantensis TaxID=2732470 RepID=UPI001D040B04|nr:uncharacterized protein KY384_006986 [Bacidia gigantensis]KAG8528070.1 hypothetical protein KY384_006986 [Bacidia gigantensis]